MSEPGSTSILQLAASVPADPTWDEAFLRVESYLRAHQIESRVLLNRLALEIVAAARERAGRDPSVEPVRLAMEITHARIGEWFQRVWPEGDWRNPRDRARGRLSLVIADLPGRWADYFFTPEVAPPELAAVLRSFTLQPGPELRFSNMPPAPLEFVFDESADERTHPSGRWQAIRALASCVVVAGIIVAVWMVSH